MESEPFPEYLEENELIEMTKKPPSVAYFNIKDINLYGKKENIEKAERIRQPQCIKCDIIFQDLHTMSKHLNLVHKLNFCYICIDHLKKLPKDYELYKSSELSIHFKTHPKCFLCDKMLLNENMLRVHRKKNHFQCEVCDEIKKVSVFNTHQELTTHFKNYHILCEYGECLRIKMVVFASKIDYHRHLVQDHSSLFNKSQRRQLLNFSNTDYVDYALRGSDQNSHHNSHHNNHHNSHHNNHQNGDSRNIIDIVNEMRIAETETLNQDSLALNDYNFPHLNSASKKIEAELVPINQNTNSGNLPYGTLSNNSLKLKTYPILTPSTLITPSTQLENQNEEFPILNNTFQNVEEPLNRQQNIIKYQEINEFKKEKVEEFPSFSSLESSSFPGESRLWSNAPIINKKHVKKSQPVPSLYSEFKTQNQIAKDLGIRNLNVQVETKKSKKKKNGKKLNGNNMIKSSINKLNNSESLSDLVKNICKNNDLVLAQFMKVCAQFARGEIETIDFKNKSIQIIGNESDFMSIIPKLAEEMPDLEKSKALLNLK